ncbi:MAG TPA: hypothetical protein VN579_04465 [Bryobacteraceae bacterium]|nr:hypothetical protein [Bryobacteraceae bacterium]
MPRPLLDRLHDIEHALKLDKQPLHAATIREAIEELQRLQPPSAEIIPLHPQGR